MPQPRSARRTRGNSSGRARAPERGHEAGEDFRRLRDSRGRPGLRGPSEDPAICSRPAASCRAVRAGRAGKEVRGLSVSSGSPRGATEWTSNWDPRRAHGRGSSSGSMGPPRRAARGSEPPPIVSSCAHLTRFPFLAATSEHEVVSTPAHARLVPNPWRERGYGGPPRGPTRPISFHRTMPGYAPTPVVAMPELAVTGQVAGVAWKNEQARAAAHVRGHWYCPDTVGAGAADEERTFASDVMAGYGTLFEEFFDQILRPPDLLFVQAGVGGLSAAAVSSLRRISATARVVVVEPEGSNSIALSFASGAPVSVPDTPTVMACLRCQSASFVAWPILLAGIDAAMVVTDAEAAAAVRELARRGVIAGASGAAGLAGALVASADGMLRARLGISADSQVAVVNTEGATDPASYAAILAG